MRPLGLLALFAAACAVPPRQELRAHRLDPLQTPGWTADDMEFFLHGSMCNEFLPERILKAFQAAYPALFPGGGLEAFGTTGLGADPETVPVGFSRLAQEHLGRLPSYGINCASCHTAVVEGPDSPRPRLILGPAGFFDVQSFIGAVLVAMQRTQEPAAMEAFLVHYLRQCGETDGERLLRQGIERQRAEIHAAIVAERPGPGLVPILPYDLDLSTRRLKRGDDLVPTVQALLRLFHNMRVSLNVPDGPLPPPPAVFGPGRTDAFGVLAQALLGVTPAAPAPVKYGVLWNLSSRPWVHWDGNNNNPMGRNIAAVLGLGAPGDRFLHVTHLGRHTTLTESIKPPRYPWAVDEAAAARGRPHYETQCARCHDGPENDSRLYEVGTDPNRLTAFTAEYAKGFNAWLRGRTVEGYTADADWVRPTGKYWACSIDGVWARSPYLHNGSVRTMRDLLAPPASRPRTWKRGSIRYDPAAMGYVDGGAFIFDTSAPGNSAAGHDYGTGLSDAEKSDLIEYLKTR